MFINERFAFLSPLLSCCCVCYAAELLLCWAGVRFHSPANPQKIKQKVGCPSPQTGETGGRLPMYSLVTMLGWKLIIVRAATLTQ